MRFAKTALVLMGLLASVSQAGAADSTAKKHHKIKLPSSYSALVKTPDQSGFTVSQPLLLSVSNIANDNASIVRERRPLATVLQQGTPQGYYPMSETQSSGLNFTGLTRQYLDVTRSASTDTAGLMSWTGKFN